MRTILRYVDGNPEWSENVPSRARIPWTVAGSVSGITTLPTLPPRDHSAAIVKGWETRRLRGTGLEP